MKPNYGNNMQENVWPLISMSRQVFQHHSFAHIPMYNSIFQIEFQIYNNLVVDSVDFKELRSLFW